ncbi:AraC family transcriptional regulator [Oceanospirillum sediminis]|uniref:AraC family transcriptional regulator n=1 Tax=Oceanospirillum sediminis TaxID=2760088 RepID=A0A839IS71_9GAMM|nr:AraC family transcriptional regulator [Oceanospirillum sediminis]MBB1487329.1 AraC family transcriptional regulator [Oceanospirillum sediminis]
MNEVTDQNNVQGLVRQALKVEHRPGDHSTRIPGLTLHLRNNPTDPLHCIYTLSLAVVLQGEKQISYGNQTFSCTEGQLTLTTFDLPVVSHVTHATRHKPFIGLVLKLDYNLILQVCSELKLNKPAGDIAYKSISVENLDDGLTDALKRLLNLQHETRFVDSLLPLLEKEIIIRLMESPHGPQLRYLASDGSPGSQILKVVAWLKQNFTQSIAMDDLAGRANMSGSAFRQHFKSLTGTSPLQYLKTLRLQEARDQMLMNRLDASQASSLVGYESASQFSREYSRLFGLPPSKDVQQLRRLL